MQAPTSLTIVRQDWKVASAIVDLQTGAQRNSRAVNSWTATSWVANLNQRTNTDLARGRSDYAAFYRIV